MTERRAKTGESGAFVVGTGDGSGVSSVVMIGGSVVGSGVVVGVGEARTMVLIGVGVLFSGYSIYESPEFTETRDVVDSSK